MRYRKLNSDWNAEPNAPMPVLETFGDRIRVEFELNSFTYDHITEGKKGRLTFFNVHKYSFNACNDERYFIFHQYRYSDKELPWGEFYEIDTDWESDFYEPCVVLDTVNDKDNLTHFIMFFRDNILECVAERYEFTYMD